jgi:hypothetical protein
VNSGPWSILLYCYYRLPFTHFIYILANYCLLPHDTFSPLFTANRWDWQPHSKLGQSTWLYCLQVPLYYMGYHPCPYRYIIERWFRVCYARRVSALVFVLKYFQNRVIFVCSFLTWSILSFFFHRIDMCSWDHSYTSLRFFSGEFELSLDVERSSHGVLPTVRLTVKIAFCELL